MPVKLAFKGKAGVSRDDLMKRDRHGIKAGFSRDDMEMKRDPLKMKAGVSRDDLKMKRDRHRIKAGVSRDELEKKQDPLKMKARADRVDLEMKGDRHRIKTGVSKIDLEMKPVQLSKTGAFNVDLEMIRDRHWNNPLNPIGEERYRSKETVPRFETKPSTTLLPDVKLVPHLETKPSTSHSGESKHPVIDVKDNHEAKIPMDLTVYRAAKQTDIDIFVKKLGQVANEKELPLSAVFDQVSPIGNTYLHVAASSNNEEIARLIAHYSKQLVTKKNFDGDTALHLTARAGYRSTTATLFRLWKDNVHLPSAEGEDKSKEDQEHLLPRLKNEKGNTPLHEALLNDHSQIACDLIDVDPEVAFYPNNEWESPLYLAAKAGYKDCVSLILSLVSGELEEMIDRLKAGKSPFHAVISSRNRDVLEFMLEKAAKLTHFVDEEGRFPLHYAASLGYLEGVGSILNKFPSSANERDKKGLLSIHWASFKGHVHIIKELLLHSPESTELLDQNGRNILHFAAQSGKDKVAGYVLKDRSFEGLINMKNKKGNTPLHLAAMNWHPKFVSALIWDSRVNLKVENNKGMTALDAATYYADEEPSFQQRLTWTVLKSGGVSRAMHEKIPDDNKQTSTPTVLESGGVQRSRYGKIPDDNKQTSTPTVLESGGVQRSLHGKIPDVNRQSSPPTETMTSLHYKDRVNTLLLVATLVATVTFAAGFTVPGGYNNAAPYEGMATMLNEKKFHAFIFCDTIAMYSSIIVAVSLIWAQLGDLNLVIVALKLALPLLGIALASMSLAFMVGLSAVVSKLKWLDNAILIMGVIFLVILLAFFLPLFVPIASHKGFLRYIFYYPFLLLIYVTNADPASVED